MIKARAMGEDGRPLYVFGLTEDNLGRLRAGQPIYFGGAELGLPNHHFLIAYVAAGHQLRLLHDKFGKDDPRFLCTFGFDAGELDNLRHRVVELDGKIYGLEGRFLIAAGTDQTLAAALQIELPATPTPRGHRDVYDPITGTLRRVREEPS